MKRSRIFVGILITIVMVFGMVGTVYAQPPLPSSFYGLVKFNDNAPVVGNIVEAYVPGISGPVATTAIKLDGADLVYNINVPGDIPDTTGEKEGGTDGEAVTFKIGTRIVATATWHQGTNVSLNFHPPAANAGGPYNGSVGQAVSFTGSSLDWGADADKYEWDWNNDGTYDQTAQSPTHTWNAVGTYTVGLKVTDLQKGEGKTTVDVVIGKGTATVNLSGLSATFDGSAKSVSATSVPAGLTIDITYDGSSTAPTNANTYAVVATVNDTNYQGSSSGSLVISKASSTTVVSGGGTYTFDGLTHVATVTVTGIGGLSLTPAPVYSGSCTSAPINVSDTPCTASYTYSGDTNHLGSTDTTEINIQAKATTIQISDLSFTYDGSSKSVTVTTDPVGLSHTVTYEGSSTPPSAVGSYNVIATITDQNYSGSDADTLVISKATAGITLNGLTQTFDGSPKPVSATTSPLGLTVNYTYEGSATAPTDAGSYAVVATIDDANYQGTTSGTLVIDKAASTTVVSGGGTFEYDGNVHAATISVTGAGGLSLTPSPVYSGSCSSAPVNVADTPCTASYTYAGDSNHYGGTDNDVITITPKPASITISNVSFIYDGNPKSVTITTNPVGLAHTVTYNGSTTAPSAAGSYNVVATITNSNYSGSSSDTMVISAFHSISLVPGWNLVSFSLHPSSTAVVDVLSSIAGNYDLVYAWDATGGHAGSGNWLRADNNPMTSDTLVNLDETMGFWIHMTAADTLEIVGSVPSSTDITLSTIAGGWNLVGYPSAASGSLPASLTAHSTLVYTHHAADTGDPWKLYDRNGAAWANDLTSLTAGWGYWVYATSGETWSIGY